VLTVLYMHFIGVSGASGPSLLINDDDEIGPFCRPTDYSMTPSKTVAVRRYRERVISL